MRHNFILSLDPRNIRGGVRTYVNFLSKELINAGHNVRFICSVDHSKKFIENITFEDIGRIKGNMGFFLKLSINANKIRWNPDDVINGQRADWLYPFRKKANKKIIVLHGQQLAGIKKMKSFLIYRFYKSIEKTTMNYVDRIIAEDSITLDYYLKQYPNIRKKIVKIPVGVDRISFLPMNRNEVFKKLDLDPETHYFSFIGRFEREKRLDRILNGFSKLDDKLKKSVELLLIGSGREISEIEHSYSYQKNKDHIQLIGHVEYEDIPLYLNASDALLLLSDFEGSPNIVKEALSCGVPVISTKVGDVPELVDGSNGIIIKNGDDGKEIANGITTVINRDWDRKKISDGMDNYSWKSINTQYLELIDSI